ncbi:MAG: universal stress protein, partial [Proteobacteria bacterium]|nr:universal stress protein [Pseudomonadota bacterium]
LAIDGSEYAQNAVRYVAELGPFKKMKVVLFNVFSGVPESYRDLEKDPQFFKAAREVLAWEMQQKKKIQESMEKARQTLIRSGIPQDAITVKIQNRIVGIARDIINEAQKGYDAVVVGRKGMNTFQEIVMGSIATKIVQKLAFLPLLMIGSFPPDNKILVAMDNSENAMQAVNFVAETLGGFDFKITLFHVIRGARDLQSGISDLFFPQESSEIAGREIEDVFYQAEQRLKKAGFKKGQIIPKVVTDVPSRAGAIVAEARAGDYGTIVLGRRGLSKVQEFVMGRVGNKVINTIRNRAVWVVT